MTAATNVYAIVEKGTVTNVVVATAAFVANIKGAVRIDTITPRPGVGWSYASKKWTPPPPVPERVAPQFQVTLDGLLPT